MPLIRPRHVVSFSSEDAAQPTQNLLKVETYRKWRCEKEGEKQASVILELERATRIHSIDIGNNGSALVEVLVGRSSWSSEEPYQVLLVTSSFMSPAESKSFSNTNRVRMFGPEKLSKPVAAQKWDRIKLVCTQPFNKNEQYGLSFVNLHSPPEDTDGDAGLTTAGTSVPTPKRLGSFTMKDDEEDKKLTPGSLFFKKLQKKPSPPPMSVAAQVRAASTAVSTSDERMSDAGSGTRAIRHPVVERKSNAGDGTRDVRQAVVAKDRGDKAPKSASDRISAPSPQAEDKPQRRTNETSKRKHESSPMEDKRGKSQSSSSKHSVPSPPPAKKKRESPVDDDKATAFEDILNGVVFVMSGFVNPERATLRDKATQMGAQYKPDWGKGCTHLICAFANTPKFYQVKGKGKIVTKKWISDCFKKQKRLATRNYRLPRDSSSSEDSTEEEEEVKHKRPQTKRTTETDSQRVHARNDASNTATKDSSPVKTKTISENKELTSTTSSESRRIEEDEDDIYGGSTDDEPQHNNKSKSEKVPRPLSPKESSSSEHDTEDELRRVQAEDDIYGGTTDDEKEDAIKQDKTESAVHDSSGPEELPSLPDFFSHKHFLLYGEFDSATRRLLIRYITAYNGSVEEYMKDTVDFVITEEGWDRNFDEALGENASLAFVRPKWIMACHEKGAQVPFQPYIIVPS